MNLSDAIKLKYPDEIKNESIILQDDGRGIYIKEWFTDSIPTQKDVDDWLNDPLIKLQHAQRQVEDYLRELIDSKPTEKGYDNILTLMSYTNSTNEQWKAEADSFIAWRDSVFEYCYGVLYKVQNAEIPMPTIEEFITNLPELVWP